MAGRRSRNLRRDELALWALVMRSVTPLPGRPPLAEPQPEPAPAQAAPPAPTADAPRAEVARPRVAAPPGPLERRLRLALKRGALPIDAVLDLHGMRQDEAHRALTRFLVDAGRRGERIVLVITGKGGVEPDIARSGERGVLRRLVPHWLAQPNLRGLVAGVEEAGQRHGGSGALYVRLRRPRL
ncbi:Smr/MutS family protein [Chelatococcus reniformis]|uniref:DNA mismatch repair protein MutS n=1 Tax=Chelatococcus reniformis TaxID=1494448 RepID=A0A916X8E0_9HYPH|nr:Smr/MutS family protein [Chelatococcus reniformis]GGC51681.1 DNA mismatch repair protein MutS [Chelatococcus reniformis]